MAMLKERNKTRDKGIGDELLATNIGFEEQNCVACDGFATDCPAYFSPLKEYQRGLALKR